MEKILAQAEESNMNTAYLVADNVPRDGITDASDAIQHLIDDLKQLLMKMARIFFVERIISIL